MERKLWCCAKGARTAVSQGKVHPGTSASLVVGGMDEGVIKNLEK